MIIRSAAGLADTKIHEPTAMVGQTSCALIESGRSRSATDLSANRFFACFSCSRLHSISCYKPLLNNLKHAQRSFSVVGVQRVRIPPSPPSFAPPELRMARQDEEPKCLPWERGAASHEGAQAFFGPRLTIGQNRPGARLAPIEPGQPLQAGFTPWSRRAFGVEFQRPREGDLQ